MPFLAADRQSERARIRWLIRLRWVAVLSVLSLLGVVTPTLGLFREAWPMLAIAVALAAWNAALSFAHRHGRAIQTAGFQVAMDLLALGGLLYFSGGLQNPFSIVIVVQVILGAILIPSRTAIQLGVLGSGITVALAFLELADALPTSRLLHAADEGPLSLWAVDLALIVTIGVALQFTITIMEDLRTNAREAEKYHKEAERERTRVVQLMHSLGAAMVVLDADFRVRWQNPMAEEVLGRLSTDAPFLLPGAEPWPVTESFANLGHAEREWSGKDRRGRTRVYQVAATAVRLPDKSLDQVILILTDITDRRAAEQQLHRTEKLAALGRLAAGVAHEINTPLGSVRILASEAVKSLESDPELSQEARKELREALTDIRQETERMVALVRRLLDLSHPGNDRVSSVDLGLLVEDCVRLISVRSPKSRARLKTETSEAPSVATVVDRLRQVLLNILDNAIDATRTNGGQILVKAWTLGGQAVIDVKDQGDGIDDSDLAHVFEPFFTTKEVGEGTGLGLYVSYEIMKNLGGEIHIESRRGEGTLVRLTLPFRTHPV